MPVKIEDGDTIGVIAQKLLGDARLTSDVQVPGWLGDGPLPVGQVAYVKGERMGPPTKNWIKR